MSLPLEFHPLAAMELGEAIECCERAQPGTGLDLLATAERGNRSIGWAASGPPHFQNATMGGTEVAVVETLANE